MVARRGVSRSSIAEPVPFPPNTHNMNKQQISTLWVVALIIDTATLVALCVTIGLIW